MWMWMWMWMCTETLGAPCRDRRATSGSTVPLMVEILVRSLADSFVARLVISPVRVSQSATLE